MHRIVAVNARATCAKNYDAYNDRLTHTNTHTHIRIYIRVENVQTNARTRANVQIASHHGRP